jgi:hypothetical protein
MSTDYTVVIASRVQFGDEESIEAGAPLVGPALEFRFLTPNADLRVPAVLMFQSRGVHHPHNILKVNNVDVPGGIPVNPNDAEWNGNIMLIPVNILNSTPGSVNTMRIESRDQNGESAGNLDDFIIDNAVVLFKIRPLPNQGHDDRVSTLAY